MASQIGKTVKNEAMPALLERAKLRASLLPDLLSEAQKIAANVISGWHGRKKRGIGENFWQFRPYGEGEDFSKIDWRRSARDDQTYIKDLEWEAVHTFWVWAKFSPSMAYQSKFSAVSKQSRALVLALASIELLARSGERIGWPSLSNTFAARDAAERISFALSHQLAAVDGDWSNGFWPDTSKVQGRSQMVIISDFLDPLEDLMAKFDGLFARGIRAYLVHIIDPAEQDFPYHGRTEFIDPSNGERLTLGNAANLREKYRLEFNARIEILRNHAKRLGWGYVAHHTDGLASNVLVGFHSAMSGNFAAPSHQLYEVQ